MRGVFFVVVVAPVGAERQGSMLDPVKKLREALASDIRGRGDKHWRSSTASAVAVLLLDEREAAKAATEAAQAASKAAWSARSTAWFASGAVQTPEARGPMDRAMDALRAVPVTAPRTLVVTVDAVTVRVSARDTESKNLSEAIWRAAGLLERRSERVAVAAERGSGLAAEMFRRAGAFAGGGSVPTIDAHWEFGGA